MAMHEAVIVVAKYLIIVSLLLTLAIWVKLSRKLKLQFLIIIVASGVLALLLAYLSRKIYYNPRPFVVSGVTPYFSHAPDNGFPSDHTLLASLLGFCVYFYRKKFGILLLVIALLIGLARVVADVHHLIDIIGAIAISFVSILIIRYVYFRYYKNLPEKIQNKGL